jgi:molybdopterin synthase catalytic subunit
MIKILPSSFEPFSELQCYQKQQHALHGKYGANAIFIGTMRDFNQGDDVASMSLEYYDGMTQKQLEKITATAKARWHVLDILCIHRVGELFPNDPIVLIAVWSVHRQAAFEACSYVLEALKHEAPFWKSEQLNGCGKRWVTQNTSGDCSHNG